MNRPKNDIMEEFPETLSQFIDESTDILFAGDMLNEWELYRKFIAENIQYPIEIEFFMPNLPSENGIRTINNNRKWRYYINDYLFAVTIYFIDTNNKFIIYHCTASCFSFVVCKKELVKNLSEEWDKEFIKFMKSCGVGFGEVGRNYVINILQDICDKFPKRSERFDNLIRKIEIC